MGPHNTLRPASHVLACMLFGQTDVCYATAAQCTRLYSVTLCICIRIECWVIFWPTVVVPNFACWLLQPEHDNVLVAHTHHVQFGQYDVWLQGFWGQCAPLLPGHWQLQPSQDLQCPMHLHWGLYKLPAVFFHILTNFLFFLGWSDVFCLSHCQPQLWLPKP